MSKKATKEEFIEKAKKAHGDYYDYSKVEYVNNSTPVYIICPKHGGFWQKPVKHCSGQGCRECSNESVGLRCVKTIDEFVNDAKQIWGNKYDYSKFEYVNSKIKSTIICPIHGEFMMTPNAHLRGQGCPKCGRVAAKAAITSDKEHFLKKAKDAHGDKYDYSKVVYVNNKTKVEIICPKHGSFWVVPNNHTDGNKSGCPSCNSSKLENEMSDFLAENHIKFEREKMFKWLGRQELDFYLPDFNIAIECQGEQHFRPVDFSGHGGELKDKVFAHIKELDEQKYNLCSEHGVKLLYYSKVDEDMFLGECVYHKLDDIYKKLC